MGTHPIFESDFDCLTDRFPVGGQIALSWRLDPVVFSSRSFLPYFNT